MGSFDDLEWEDIHSYKAENEDFEINLGRVYRTIDNDPVHLTSVYQKLKEPVFIGYIESQELKKPIAAQWDLQGKADPGFFPDTYDIVGCWEEPITYTRWVYVYRENDEIKTLVTDHDTYVTNCLASRKITLR